MTGASIDLVRFLVTKDVELDAAPGTMQRGYGAFLTPIVGTVLLAVDEEARV